MPGIPLLNLGTALGGLAGGFNQARGQGLQQAIQQLALQQQQGLTNQQTLAGLALQAGLLNQPGGGQTPLGGQSFPSPQPSQINVANVTPPAPSGGGAQPGYAPPLSPGGPTAPGDMTSADEVQLNADAGQDQFGATNQAITAAGFGDQTASSGGSDATPTPAPTPTPTPAATPTDGGGSSGTPSMSSVGIDMGNGQVIPMSTMFQQMDYQKLAQGIARIAPPGTSQADIYGAVLDLAKLAEGDKVQQQQAGLLMRAMLGGNFRLAEIDRQQAGATSRTEMQQAGAGQRAQLGADTRTNIAEMNNATRTAIANQSAQLKQAGMQARNAVQWTQIAQKNQQLAQQLNIAGQREAAQAISQQLRALQARIATFKPGPDGNFTDDQQKQLQAINDQIASIGAKVGAQQGAGP